MQERMLDGMRVAILVTDDFEQVEMTDPRRALEDAGAAAYIVSPKPGTVQGMHHDEKADTFHVDVTTDRADPDDYDAVMLPGGAFNADKLRMDPHAQRFIRRIEAQDKPIAVICHAPWLLVSAGLVSGRTLAGYYTLQDDIRNAGGRWLDLEVVHDRNWVSSRGPRDLPAFDRAMTDLFQRHYARQKEAARAGAPRGDGSG